MKLFALFTIWGDPELFHHAAESIRPLVDDGIVVYSTISNFGEIAEPPQNFHGFGSWNFDPDLKKTPRENETDKRNLALKVAREWGATNFIMLDEDEFYQPDEFLKEKKRIEDNNLAGLVCRVKCYFRLPTLTIGYDTTLIPFIHKLTPDLKFEFNRNYPFAWTDTNGVPFTPGKRIRIDPTRSMNITSGVEWSEITMHHMSWVRKDIKKKIRNSTARQNIEKSTIVSDYINAKAGYFCNFYGKVLEECPNVFGIPEIIDVDVKNTSI